MTEPMPDDQLLALLAETLGDERPPADAVEAAYAAEGWRTIDVDLARLVDDVALEVAGFGTELWSRALAYTAGPARIDVVLHDDELEIGIAPAPAAVTIRWPTGAADLVVDTGSEPGSGRFRWSGVVGPACLDVTWPDGSRARTPWMTV